ncbi:MAG: hypothetical protein IJD59_03265 [Clostridia bacterium]|nr:hypothetical protein [Clostridia bacterium]
MGEIRRRAVYEVGTSYGTAATIRGDSPLNFRLSDQKINAVAPQKRAVSIAEKTILCYNKSIGTQSRQK